MAGNKRIPELALRSSLTGEVRFAVYNPLTNTTDQTRLSDFLPEAGTDSFDWDPTTTYAEDDIVVFEDQVWISQDNGNLDNPPFDGSAFWSIGVKGSNGIVPWEAGIFTANTVLKLYEISPGVWGLYYLISATRPYNSTNFVTELGGGDWVIVQVPVGTFTITDYDASVNAYPTGTIPKNTIYRITTPGQVGGNLNGNFWPDSTWLVARVDLDGTDNQLEVSWDRRV